MKVLINMNKILSGRLRKQKNKEKSNLVTPKVVAVAYESGRKESSTTFRFVILLPFSRSCDGFIFILRRFM